MKKFSIVIPIYGNEKNIPITIPYIVENIPVLFSNYKVEIIMVNDGSPDNSWDIMKIYQKKYPEIIRIVSLTRNFGQDLAIHCGVSMAKGDVIGVISADMQDPLNLFEKMLIEWENGKELICGIRESRDEKGIEVLFSKITNYLIHEFITKEYPIGGFDFFVMDRKVADQYIKIQEKNGSLQMLLLWLGPKTFFIPYVREKRKIGKSGWTLSKKIKMFIDTFVTNTYFPLRMMSILGFSCSIGAFAYAAMIVVSALIWEQEVTGWSSLATLITFFSGLTLASLGIIGEYLWRIFDAVKGRPLYLIDKIVDDIEGG